MLNTLGIRTALVAGVIGLLPCAGAAAHGARPQPEGPAVVVSYADLDLGTRQGAELLYGRIQQAAAHLCPQVAIQELPRYAAALRCRSEIVARTVNGIDSAQLAAVYAAHSHHLGRNSV
jgi:UrcA family protein